MKIKTWLILVIVLIFTACSLSLNNPWRTARTAAYYCTVGKRHMSKGNYKDAIIYFQKALQLDRNSICARENAALAHFNMGNEYLEWKQYALARDQFKISLTLNPDLSIAKRALREANRNLQSSAIEQE